MHYVMSDLHGCYEEYLELLRKIRFSDEDVLYVLGDVIDRGPEPVTLLQDMMMRSNVIPLIGNHEYMAMRVLRKLCVEITEETSDGEYLNMDDMTSYLNWSMDGGQITMEQFRKLNAEEKTDMLEYLEEFSLYEEVTAGGRDYVLVHAGLEPFVPGKHLKDYTLAEMIFQSPDYNRVYFENRYLVTGHTPTITQENPEKAKVLEQNHHIAIDCGCVFGGRLAVYCLDTGKAVYADRK